MTSNACHSVSVAACIVDALDRILVIQRADNGEWEPPGGVLETHEAIEDGLRREVREETGLEISIDRLTGVYKNQTRGVLALVFRARAMTGTLAVNDEVRSFRWLIAEEVADLVREVYAVRLLDALRADQLSAQVRSHDGVRVKAKSPPHIAYPGSTS